MKGLHNSEAPFLVFYLLSSRAERSDEILLAQREAKPRMGYYYVGIN